MRGFFAVLRAIGRSDEAGMQGPIEGLFNLHAPLHLWIKATSSVSSPLWSLYLWWRVVFQSPVAEAGPEVPATVTPETTPKPSVPLPTAPPSPMPPEPPQPFRISYTAQFWDRPCCHLPDNLTFYGGVRSAVEEQCRYRPRLPTSRRRRGGITETFHVPYAVWRLNCSVSCNDTAWSGTFQDGVGRPRERAIVEGADLRYPGSIIQKRAERR